MKVYRLKEQENLRSITIFHAMARLGYEGLISGQGAADIGDSFVFVGSILLKFDTKLMSQLFRVPEEKFRDKLYKTLEENISWGGGGYTD